jgi:hypothetical protein
MRFETFMKASLVYSLDQVISPTLEEVNIAREVSNGVRGGFVFNPNSKRESNLSFF